MLLPGWSTESLRVEKITECPPFNPTLPSLPLNQVTKSHMHTSFKSFQGWWLHHFIGQPVRMIDNSSCAKSCEAFFPNILNFPGLTWGRFLLFYCLLLCRRDWPPCLCNLLPGSYREQKDPPWVSSSPGWAPHLPQPFFTSLVLWSLDQLCYPFLDTLQHLCVFLLVRGPKVNTKCIVGNSCSSSLFLVLFHSINSPPWKRRTAKSIRFIWSKSWSF